MLTFCGLLLIPDTSHVILQFQGKMPQMFFSHVNTSNPPQDTKVHSHFSHHSKSSNSRKHHYYVPLKLTLRVQFALHSTNFSLIISPGPRTKLGGNISLVDYSFHSHLWRICFVPHFLLLETKCLNIIIEAADGGRLCVTNWAG